MRAIIISGGKAPSKELLLSYIKEDDILIGVDKGCDVFYEYNIIPNIILGDFDSAKKEYIEEFIKKGVKIEKYNPEKGLYRYSFRIY